MDVLTSRKYRKTTLVTFPGYEHTPLEYHSDYEYPYNYAKLFRQFKSAANYYPQYDDWYRALVLNDLFFITYFHLRIKKANHPFVIARCREIMSQPDTGYLDLWARGHFKSTLLTTAKPIQKIMRNPEERICIFSFKRDNALKFFLPIKELLEKDVQLIKLFPDILDPDPRQYPLWTRDLGITVKRKGFYREPTVMWSAMMEGLPTGMHFTGKIYDDIMTADMARSPAQMEQAKFMFDMSQNLADNDTGHDQTQWEVIAGTPYHFNDVMIYIENLKNYDGSPAYQTRKYPATKDGTIDGEPVLLTQQALDKLKRDKRSFASQQLLNPVHADDRTLNFKHLVEIPQSQLPKNLYKFLLVDPAGTMDHAKSHKGDRWAVALIGVEPVRDTDTGTANIYILDLWIRTATFAEAIGAISRMYLLGGRIIKVGVEKVATSTYEIHIANALKRYGRHLSVKSGSLVLLRPGMRNKHTRIQDALSWPLENRRVHYVDTLQHQDLQTLRTEMDSFPLGADDGLDILSYTYDLIKDYRFPEREAQPPPQAKPNDLWLDEDDPRVQYNGMRGWMVA